VAIFEVKLIKDLFHKNNPVVTHALPVLIITLDITKFRLLYAFMLDIGNNTVLYAPDKFDFFIEACVNGSRRGVDPPFVQKPVDVRYVFCSRSGPGTERH
jgi:hypothetical protein